MSQQIFLTSRRPRLHNAATSRPAPLSPRSRWLEDVTGLREGEQRDPPPPSAEARLEELKEQVFKNRNDNYYYVYKPGRSQAKDPSLTNTKTTRNSSNKKPSAFCETNKNVRIKHSNEMANEKKRSLSRSDRTSTSSPSSLVDSPFASPTIVEQPPPLKPTPMAYMETQTESAQTSGLETPPSQRYMPQEVYPPMYERHQEAWKPTHEAKDVAARVLLQSVEAIQPSVAKQGKHGKATSWLRKAVAVLDASTRRSVSELDVQATVVEEWPSLPPRYNHETSPMRQQLWMSEIWKALNEVKVAEELLRLEKQEVISTATAAKESLVMGHDDMNDDTPTEAKSVMRVAPTRLPDYYAAEGAVRCTSEDDVDDDEEESISSVQVLVNWCCGDYYISTAPAHVRLHAGRHLVTSTE